MNIIENEIVNESIFLDHVTMHIRWHVVDVYDITEMCKKIIRIFKEGKMPTGCNMIAVGCEEIFFEVFYDDLVKDKKNFVVDKYLRDNKGMKLVETLECEDDGEMATFIFKPIEEIQKRNDMS